MKKLVAGSMIVLALLALLVGLHFFNQSTKTITIEEYSTHDIELLNIQTVNMKDGRKFNDNKGILLFFNENGNHYTFEVKHTKTLFGSSYKVISKELIK